MKNLIVSCFVLVFVLIIGAAATSAQAVPASNNPNASAGPLSEGEIALMRKDLRGEKKKIVALNVPMTEDEATRFWPVYDKYVGEMTKIHDAFYANIKDYTENSKGWTDAQAAAFLDKWADLQLQDIKTRQKFVPLIAKAITAKKAALFFQIDRRLYALLDLQVSTFLPLTQ